MKDKHLVIAFVIVVTLLMVLFIVVRYGTKDIEPTKDELIYNIGEEDSDVIPVQLYGTLKHD